jgi:hypothetical protein
MKHLGTILLMSVVMMACGSKSEEAPKPDTHPATHLAFFDNVSTFCGETFVGASTFPDNPDHPLVDTELRTHVSQCSEDMIRIELIRDGDYWHGAWVLERRDDGLHLFHDHLGEVRTMEDLLASGDSHGYGGYATDQGSDIQQFFAADEATAEMLPAAATNVWMMEIDFENSQFIYYLERHNEPRFRAVVSKI